MKQSLVLCIVAGALVLASSACSSGGSGTAAVSTPAVPAAGAVSWSFVDGNSATGLNRVASNSAIAPRLTVFGVKLYAAWEEQSTPSQVHVSVYNGNDSAPSWLSVDGSGISHPSSPSFAPQLTVFNNKLYATWHECDGSATLCQVRVSVYNGNDSSPSWTFVDGGGVNGINNDPSRNAQYPQLTAFGPKLYATWNETNGASYQVRAAVYNGNDSAPSWTFVDGGGTSGMNWDAAYDAGASQLAVFGPKLYATWNEMNGTASQVRVAVYNGNDSAPSWTFVDGNAANGINKDATEAAFAPQLTAFGSKLYASWAEANGTTDQVRAAVYNGNDSAPAWTFVDGGGTNGINRDPTRIGLNPQLMVFGAGLYAAWQESNGSAYQVRVAVYNGNDSAPAWTFADGGGMNGLNWDATKSAQMPQLTVFGTELFAAWQESNGIADQIRVAAGRQ